MAASDVKLRAEQVPHKKVPVIFNSWSDGQQQWAHPSQWGNDSDHKYFVERVVKTGTRRKQWCIVDRQGRGADYRLYPPIVAGPFPNIKAALTAYLVMVGGAW